MLKKSVIKKKEVSFFFFLDSKDLWTIGLEKKLENHFYWAASYTRTWGNAPGWLGSTRVTLDTRRSPASMGELVTVLAERWNLIVLLKKPSHPKERAAKQCQAFFWPSNHAAIPHAPTLISRAILWTLPLSPEYPFCPLSSTQLQPQDHNLPPYPASCPPFHLPRPTWYQGERIPSTSSVFSCHCFLNVDHSGLQRARWESSQWLIELLGGIISYWEENEGGELLTKEPLLAFGGLLNRRPVQASAGLLHTAVFAEVIC